MCEVCKWIKDKSLGGDENLAVLALPSGTAVVATRAHAKLSTLSPPVQERFLTMANEISIVLYESVQAHGTNIIIEDREHAHALIVPRFENDALPYTWEGKRVSPKDLQETANKLSDATWTIGKKEASEQTNPTIVERAPERASKPKVAAEKELEIEREDMHSPGSHDGTDLGDVAAEVQKEMKHGPTEEKDYRIRQLTRRR